MQSTIYILSSIAGDELSFNVDSPHAHMEGETLVIPELFCAVDLVLVFRDIPARGGRIALSAVAALADPTSEERRCKELHFVRGDDACRSPAIPSAAATVKHTQELSIVVLAWSVQPMGETFGAGPQTARGRLPVKVIRVPDGGG